MALSRLVHSTHGAFASSHNATASWSYLSRLNKQPSSSRRLCLQNRHDLRFRYDLRFPPPLSISCEPRTKPKAVYTCKSSHEQHVIRLQSEHRACPRGCCKNGFGHQWKVLHDVDVLITHTPPHEIHDLSTLKELKQRVKPSFQFIRQIHEPAFFCSWSTEASKKAMAPRGNTRRKTPSSIAVGSTAA